MCVRTYAYIHMLFLFRFLLLIFFPNVTCMHLCMYVYYQPCEVDTIIPPFYRLKKHSMERLSSLPRPHSHGGERQDWNEKSDFRAWALSSEHCASMLQQQWKPELRSLSRRCVLPVSQVHILSKDDKLLSPFIASVSVLDIALKAGVQSKCDDCLQEPIASFGTQTAHDWLQCSALEKGVRFIMTHKLRWRNNKTKQKYLFYNHDKHNTVLKSCEEQQALALYHWRRVPSSKRKRRKYTWKESLQKIKYISILPKIYTNIFDKL